MGAPGYGKASGVLFFCLVWGMVRRSAFFFLVWFTRSSGYTASGVFFLPVWVIWSSVYGAASGVHFFGLGVWDGICIIGISIRTRISIGTLY